MIQVQDQTFAALVNNLITFVNQSVTPLLFALALICFLIGIARFFFSENNENREKGRQFAIWGLIGLVVISSIWGIVNLFLNAFK